MSDRDLAWIRRAYDGMGDDRLNEYAEEVARLRAQVGRLQAAARKAHDAMTNWHFVHGEPSALMSPEEAEMGEACKTIAALLDEEPPQRQEISVHCDQCGGQWFWPTFNGELHLQTCHEHSDPPERDDGYTGPRIYVGGSEIRPFRDIVEDDDVR